MVYSIFASLLLASASAVSIEKRQAAPADGSATLAQRAAFFCPPGIVATLPLDNGQEGGLRFCSNIDRWSPATLFSSRPLSVGSGNYRGAASSCAALCVNQCQTFSVAPATPGNATFNCNLYNATVPFRGNTTGGLFYARQAPAGGLLTTTTITTTVCPAAVAVATAAAVAPAPGTVTRTVTGPTAIAAVVFPVIFAQAGQVAVTVTAANQVVTRTVTSTTTIGGTATAVAVQSVAPFAVFIGQVGNIEVTTIINNIVTVVVVVVNGNVNSPVSTSTAPVAAPTATNTFQCPAGIVGQYQDTTNPGSMFNLRFCSNTQRWSPADLFSSTQIAGATYASAAQICSQRCNSTICQTFSVAPTTVGGSTFGCNLYNATNVFNGPTNGGLFYQRVASINNNPTQADQCVGSVTPVTAGGVSYTREFCSRTERWSPATLFDGTVQTGTQVGATAAIVEAVQKCAARCSTFGARCQTFSTTFSSQNPPTAFAGVPVNFNCNIYNATLRVAGATQGGAFYLSSLAGQGFNSTMVKRFI